MKYSTYLNIGHSDNFVDKEKTHHCKINVSLYTQNLNGGNKLSGEDLVGLSK